MRTVFALIAVLGTWTAASLADAAPSSPSALASLQPGQWTLRARDGGIPPRSICLGDPRQLIQPRHAGAVCSRFVIADDPRETTIHYTCPGAGHGRTTVRVETGRLAQIDSQGIADNSPFAWSLEARRTGECGGGARAGR